MPLAISQFVKSLHKLKNIHIGLYLQKLFKLTFYSLSRHSFG